MVNCSKVTQLDDFLSLEKEQFCDPGRQLPALPEASPDARLQPYFSRACPQDDVSSTRQTPSNYDYDHYYYHYYYYNYYYNGDDDSYSYSYASSNS